MKLVVFDSFAAHLRATDMNYNERKRQISYNLMNMGRLADKYQVQIVLVNQMKSGKKDFMGDGVAKPEPLFGEDMF